MSEKNNGVHCSLEATWHLHSVLKGMKGIDINSLHINETKVKQIELPKQDRKEKYSISKKYDPEDSK